MSNSREILLDSFEKYCLSTSETRQKNFFKNWLSENGKTYSFVFKQNLFVTNIQFRELIDLIQLNVSKDNKNIHVNFLNTNDFLKLVSDIIESFIDEADLKKMRAEKEISISIKKRLEIVCNNYINLFENTIIVDAFYTSCVVAIPCSLQLDITQICFQSGYVHSCGESVYVRNIQKAKYENFVEKMSEYINKNENEINLIMYTHEQYSIKNKLYVNSFEKHGLDEIKFYEQKFYMKDMSLMELAARLNNEIRLKGRLHVLDKEKVKNKKNNECIWLIIDRSIGADLKYPGDKRYYICYKQLYINENPFHIFDEDKPGWINHVTIPHTLAGAMLNIGRSGCENSGEKCKVIDPFVGSGTMFLETLKYEDIDFYGGDINGLVTNTAKLNLDFFSLDENNIKNIADFTLMFIKNIDSDKYEKIKKDLCLNDNNSLNDRLEDIIVSLRNGLIDLEEELKVDETKFTHDFDKMANKLVEQVMKRVGSREDLLVTKENGRMICQIWLYIVWKTYRRNEYAFQHDADLNLVKGSVEEFKAFYFRIKSFLNVRKRSKNVCEEHNDNERVRIYFGKYTKGCSLNYNFLIKIRENYPNRIQSSIDVTEFLKQFEIGSVDLIVTDPPYGFNTMEEKESFSQLYIAFIDKMVQTMKNGGQIILCLPAFSYSGKAVNIFAQKEIVSRQFSIAAEKNNMYLVEKKENLPQPEQLYSFPFYWDSEKALRRDILRFQFFKKNSLD